MNRIEDGKPLIPHEVVELVIKKEFSLLKAWRKHLGLTQKEVARCAVITQSALSQIERTADNNRTATLEKLAKALGIETSQIPETRFIPTSVGNIQPFKTQDRYCPSISSPT
jgi:transcriptional regulator with XRE-family HTH domain